MELRLWNRRCSSLIQAQILEVRRPIRKLRLVDAGLKRLSMKSGGERLGLRESSFKGIASLKSFEFSV